MSQQMHYDEMGREQPRYDAGYSPGHSYPSYGAPGQKISFSAPGIDKSASAGQRLALASVSVVMLIPILGIIMGTSNGTSSIFGFAGGLIALGLVCVTIMVINIAFNLRH